MATNHAWKYSFRSALLHLQGQPFAVVSPNCRDALSVEQAKTLLASLNGVLFPSRDMFFVLPEDAADWCDISEDGAFRCQCVSCQHYFITKKGSPTLCRICKI